MKMIMRVFLMSLLLDGVVHVKADAQTTNYQVFSLFVMNIARYSEWPGAGDELHIAVLGKSKTYDELLKYAGKGVNGRKIVITQVDNMSDVGNAHILYLSDGKSSLIDDIVKSTQGKSVMIIAEREGLFKRGAGFSFYINENNNLRFDINNTELEKRNIRVAKNLSTLAHEII